MYWRGTEIGAPPADPANQDRITAAAPAARCVLLPVDIKIVTPRVVAPTSGVAMRLGSSHEYLQFRQGRQAWLMNDLETIKGTACAVDKGTEAGKAVWRFRLDAGEGVVIPVEIRGDEIHGLLDMGDEIEVLVQSKDKTGEGVRSEHVLNRTTTYEINTYERSRLRRGFGFNQLNFYVGILAALGGAAVSILIGFLRAAGVATAATPAASPSATAGPSSASPTSPAVTGAPTPPTSAPSASGTGASSSGPTVLSPKRVSLIPIWAYYVLVALPIVAVVIFVIYDVRKNVKSGPGGVRWYLRRRNSVSIVAGVVAGDLLAILVTAFLL
jgi:hypothetical protein